MSTRNFVKNIVLYLAAFLVILNCNTVWGQQIKTNYTNILLILLLIILIVLQLPKIIDSIGTTITLAIFPMLAIYSILVINTFAKMGSFGFSNIMTIIIIPIILIIYIVPDPKNGLEFLRHIQNIMFILAIISILFWIIASLGVQPNMSLSVAWGPIRTAPGFYGVHFITQGYADFIGLNLIRNTGVFLEAPMYAYALSIALLSALFLDKKSKFRDFQIFIFFITLFSTTSTTGVVVAITSLAYNEVFVVHNRNILYRFLLFFTVGGVAVFTVVLIIQSKFTDNFNNWAGSTAIRTDDVFVGLATWLQHIWVGNGIGNTSAIIANMDSRRIMAELTGYSNGFFQVLAFGGIVNMLVYLVPTIISFKNNRVFAFGLFAFVLFSVTIIGYTYIYIIILVFLYSVGISQSDVFSGN
ncbi:hypothetical protein ABVF11_05385 [Pediococcus argentinicus]|uniref:hypothetical protein n=1 Tax=Pediococcus argentinicus TaxID=480391 RepID=UPI0033904B8D